MKSKLPRLLKSISMLACAAVLIPALFSGADQDIKIVAEIAQICNSGGDPGVWVHSGTEAPVKGRDYMGLKKGDRLLVEEKSKAVVLIRYGLPTESPLLVTRICGKTAPECGVDNINERKFEVHCLTNQTPYYEIREPVADTPLLKKVAQLFTDVFHHMGKTEYDFSVTPYSDHRPHAKQSLPFSPLAPSGCPILSNRPVFHWTGPSGQSYAVEILEKESRKKIWNSEDGSDMHLAYSGEDLSPGEYLWRVVSNKQQSVEATFEILNHEKRAAMQELLDSFDDPVFNSYSDEQLILLKASALVDQQFYADALPMLLSLKNQNSHHPGVRALLRVVYEKQGRPDLIREEKEKNAELNQ